MRIYYVISLESNHFLSWSIYKEYVFLQIEDLSYVILTFRNHSSNLNFLAIIFSFYPNNFIMVLRIRVGSIS